MATGYVPVGEKVHRNADGEIQLRGGGSYTQTYSTAARTVPNATYVAVTETVAAVAPAGGTGATAGGWDTSGHRDTAITTINECKALAEALKTQQAALAADVLAIRKVLTAIIDDGQAAGLWS